MQKIIPCNVNSGYLRKQGNEIVLELICYNMYFENPVYAQAFQMLVYPSAKNTVT